MNLKKQSQECYSILMVHYVLLQFYEEHSLSSGGAVRQFPNWQYNSRVA